MLTWEAANFRCRQRMAELGMGNGHASHHVPTPETMAVRERSSTFTVSLASPCTFTAFSVCLKRGPFRLRGLGHSPELRLNHHGLGTLRKWLKAKCGSGLNQALMGLR